MAIYSPCSDLQTRTLRWVPRTPTSECVEQRTFAGQVQAHEASFYAACYSDRYADEVGACPVSGWRSVMWG